jgi:hypothetical protein
MQRYAATLPGDSPALSQGDNSLLGVDGYNAPENLQPGMVQEAVNLDFAKQDGATRGGFVCLPELGSTFFNVSTGWTSRAAVSNQSWQSVAYGNGRFVAIATAVSGTDDVMYSVDGVTWTLLSTGFAFTSWRAITYGNGLFVVVGSGALDTDRVMTSPNGISWTLRTASALNTWRSVAYGGGLFAAVAQDGATSQIMTSPDGATWTSRTTPASTSGFTWSGITYGNSLFVAVNQQGATTKTVMTSVDGVTWVAVDAVQNTYFGVAFGNGRFVAAGTVGAQGMTSEDGATWTSRTTITGSHTWRAIAYGNGLFVAVNSDGTAATAIMSSPDGITWTVAEAPTTQDWRGIIYGAGTFVATPNGGGATVMTKSFTTTPNVTGSVLASGVYSDPDDPGSQWIMLVGTDRVGFFASERTSRYVLFASGLTVSVQSTIVQCNNLVYIFRGADDTPIFWSGNWADEFELVPPLTPTPGFSSIPNSNQATYYQNRLWVVNGKDEIAASDVLDFESYDDLANAFNLNTGSSDFLVTTYPFGENSLVVFKNKSILILQNVEGDLADVTVTEITRQAGAIGINAVVSVGPDMVYMSDRNINLVTLTTTNNSLQHKTLPLSTPIQDIIARVNWLAASKVSMGYTNNHLYVALPLDNSTVCNAVVVYNFVTETWYGEWNFDPSMVVSIQGWVVANYLGVQRMHCITEDGRIFVTGNGHQDISGTIVAEVSTSLTTRAYSGDNDNRTNRRMYVDLSTNRPNFSITAYSEGASESSAILTDRTYSRTQSWLFNDSVYDPTNANDDYNRAYRKDYSSGPDSIESGTGFLPEMTQNYRYPIVTRRRGRLCWFKITNSTGFISINGVGYEAIAGDRRSTVQV